MNILIPGLRNSGPDHWQSIWERRFPDQFLRVNQSDWEHPDAQAWTERMEQTLAPFQHDDLLLIGHSIGCMAIVKWFERYGHVLKGAIDHQTAQLN